MGPTSPAKKTIIVPVSNEDTTDDINAKYFKKPVCGNGKVQQGEVCDDGNRISGDGCRADCKKIEICGDKILDAGEVCDDGNRISGDGCRADCKKIEVCGDKVIDANEQCDDGNIVSGDGCSATCMIEAVAVAPSTSTTSSPTVVTSSTPAVCGNNSVEIGEQCDDGNILNWDGCSATCQQEPTAAISTEFLALENLWDVRNEPTGSIGFGAVNSLAHDNIAVAMMFPGVPGQGASYNTSPDYASEISTKQLLSFGTYRTRVKFAQCASTEEVVNGVFLYSYGNDTNHNGITDNNEIDFEVLCGEPNYLYLTTWTDYEYANGVETFLKVTRAIDMTTGKYYQTRPGKEGVYGYEDYVGTNADAVIPNFLTEGQFYDLGLEYHSNHLRFFIIKNGVEVTLWDYTDATYIPQNPMYFMFNTWHTDSHWWAGGSANYPANNATMSVDFFRYWAN